LKELTSAESVDVVTKAGAGGMILQESATSTTQAKEGEIGTSGVQPTLRCNHSTQSPSSHRHTFFRTTQQLENVFACRSD
jgi:hypothetical protein